MAAHVQDVRVLQSLYHPLASLINIFFPDLWQSPHPFLTAVILATIPNDKLPAGKRVNVVTSLALHEAPSEPPAKYVLGAKIKGMAHRFN